ncbi:MAG: cation-translocating P-type ATPase [Clostridia bacterium]|nr:cation-translocating P-type ATPase [Clostridia bacterium]
MYNKTREEVLEEFQIKAGVGLSQDQVQESRAKYGENKLPEKAKKPTWKIFLEQFKDLLVIILIIAAIISAITGNLDSTIVIIVVLIMNAILGTVQYVKAEKSLDALKKLSAPCAKVIRGGVELVIPAEEIVVGDLVRLEAGDIVPCDGRIIECASLKINESSLTGESESVEKMDNTINEKDVALGDQKNMAFSSSLVSYGRGVIVATGVGLNTELGKIANLMNDTEDRATPLQKTMDEFSKKLSIAIIIICVIVFALDVFRGMATLDALLFAVALAVAAIPEALSSIVTISLAIGTKKMAEENAIMRQLKAVEGLGCVSIICSDKTGTLTQNRMTVVDTYTKDEDKLLTSMILCNDTTILKDGSLGGDPTETALVSYFFDQRQDYGILMDELPRLAEIPFDSSRKLMSTLHYIGDANTLVVKGAPDVVISRCSSLDTDEKKAVSEINQKFASQGLRVLAFAQKDMSETIPLGTENPSLDLKDEFDLEFIGLVAMIDPPREESKDAVAACKAAGIIPIMITGDYQVTAAAIAKSIGIYEDGNIVMSGPELDKLSHDELMEELENIRVYARVSPENKIRIVQAWQEKGHIVAMTGDGVNDSPAIKSADVGIAMGITGTEVSKDAASMILADDNFATIVKAVLNGRNVFENIKNAIMFLLSGNAAGILVVLFAVLGNLPSPFTAIHLLFINLLTDSLPALAISMEPQNPNLLKEKPRDSSQSILNKPTLITIGYQGLLIAIGTAIAFMVGLAVDAATGATMAFITLCTARLWHGFNSRGKENIVKLGLFTNMWTIGAFIAGIALIALVMAVPFLSSIFQVSALSGMQLATIGACSFGPSVVIQIIKTIRTHYDK